MGVGPMNTGFADLQRVFGLVCPRFVPIIFNGLASDVGLSLPLCGKDRNRNPSIRNGFH